MKNFIDAEIDIKVLTADEALLVEISAGGEGDYSNEDLGDIYDSWLEG